MLSEIVVGAHLDSVAEGPGINDHGSGSSGILEIAEEVAEPRSGSAASGMEPPGGPFAGSPYRVYGGDLALTNHLRRRL